ncbi:hypothetical protein [Spirillospora sp. NPDC047279]|uniref:hypothetical protein n=1 Tax=Spirillospora sp. NPDC047279 TaxID=3155478 RepID=UPI00340FC49E
MKNAQRRMMGLAAAGLFTTSLYGIVSAPAAHAATQVAAQAAAGPCQPGEYLGKTAKAGKKTKKSLSGIYSKRNSNPKESSTLTFGMETSTSWTTTFSGSLGKSSEKSKAAAVKLIEGQFGVDVSRSTSKGKNASNTMVVRPKYYGRTRIQSIKTAFTIYQKISRRDCSISYVKIGGVNAITSKYHFAECQDKKNVCKPY